MIKEKRNKGFISGLVVSLFFLAFAGPVGVGGVGGVSAGEGGARSSYLRGQGGYAEGSRWPRHGNHLFCHKIPFFQLCRRCKKA